MLRSKHFLTNPQCPMEKWFSLSPFSAVGRIPLRRPECARCESGSDSSPGFLSG